VPDTGAGTQSRESGHADAQTAEEKGNATNHETTSNHEPQYKLQSMKWGLIPFWTKRNPDYGSMMKTINCRDDSLIDNKGMWTSMKHKKRCVVVAQGFYEWLKKGPKEKVPHYTKRKDGKLMCFAGLWDCVQYEGMEPDTCDLSKRLTRA
jgi:putative SOS response-associated peptidase YedK